MLLFYLLLQLLDLLSELLLVLADLLVEVLAGLVLLELLRSRRVQHHGLSTQGPSFAGTTCS